MKQALKAVIYTRVSSQEQAENGTSLLSQEQACFQKATSIGAQVVAPAFRDEGISVATYLGRPGLLAALSCLEIGEANTLLCYDVSRLSRDVEHHAIIERRVKNARARIVYCTQEFSDTADGELSSGILKQFAQWEKRKIRERTMSGHKRQAEKGVQPFRTLSPMGYHIVTVKEILIGQYPAGTQGTYVVLEEEAEIVKAIFQKAMAGASLTGLAKWLNESGIPTRQPAMKKTGESGRMKFWRPVTVRTILKNPVYKGETLVGRKEVITDESRRERGLKNSFYLRDRPEDECIRIPVPALVSPDTWQTVQNRLADNKARMSGRKSRRFVLSGLWRCPVCRNRGSVAHRQGKGHAYYCKTKAVCHPHAYGGKSADKAVFDTLMSLMQRPELMETAIRSYISKGSRSDAANTRAVLLKELSSLQEREQATVKAQIAGIQAGADASMYESAFGEIAKRRKELHQRLAIIEGQEDAVTCNPRDTATLFATIIADMETALSDELIEPAEKNALLSSVVRGVYPLNREGDYRVDFCPLPGSGLTVHQNLS